MRTLLLGTLLVLAALGVGAPTAAADHLCGIEPPWECAHQDHPLRAVCDRIVDVCGIVVRDLPIAIKVLLP